MSKVKIPSPTKVQSRARIWCFTINNPDEKDESHLSHQNFLNGVKSLHWQIEEGKNRTPHIQGVIQFKSQINFKNVKNKLPNAHIEICKNFIASKHYCQKEEGRISGPFIFPSKRKITHEEMRTAFYEWLIEEKFLPSYALPIDRKEEE